MNETKRAQNYDMLKVICMICIMLIHIGDDYGYYIMDGEPGYYFTLGNICLTMTTFAVPCFLMVSGAFLLSNSKNRDFIYFYKKSFKKIGIPTLFVSALYVAYNIAKLYYHRYLGMEVTDTPLKYFKEWFRGEPFYHMWYMYMIIGIYLLVPFLIRIRENVDFEIWKKIGIVVMILSIAWKKTSSFTVHWGLEGAVYLGYFLMGDVLKKSCQERGKEIMKYLFGGFLLLLMYCIGREWLIRNEMQEYLAVFQPIVAVASILIFAGFSGMSVKGNWNRIAEKSFYMYLFHAGIIDVSYNIFIGRWNPVFYIPLLLLFTFIVSYFVSYIFLQLQKKYFK